MATELPVLLAHSGYISELIVHGMGPIPAKNITISFKLMKANVEKYMEWKWASSNKTNQNLYIVSEVLKETFKPYFNKDIT